jgi:hypothetical protein
MQPTALAFCTGLQIVWKTQRIWKLSTLGFSWKRLSRTLPLALLLNLLWLLLRSFNLAM